MSWLSRFLFVPLAALLLGGASPQLVPDVSQHRIDIVYSFTGAELLLFGAILYPGGRLPTERADIAVVLRGPTEPVVVRRKEKLLGIWVNRHSTRFGSAPAYYAVASSAPLADLIDERTASIYELGTRNLQLSPGSGEATGDSQDFEEGLIALRAKTGLFLEQPRGVEITNGVLYRARLPIPARVPVGKYTAETFLIQDGKVIARATRQVAIDKSGFERFVYVAAQDHALLYGITAVLISLGLGLAAGALFRK